MVKNEEKIRDELTASSFLFQRFCQTPVEWIFRRFFFTSQFLWFYSVRKVDIIKDIVFNNNVTVQFSWVRLVKGFPPLCYLNIQGLGVTFVASWPLVSIRKFAQFAFVLLLRLLEGQLTHYFCTQFNFNAFAIKHKPSTPKIQRNWLTVVSSLIYYSGSQLPSSRNYEERSIANSTPDF